MKYLESRGRDSKGAWPDEMGVALLEESRETVRAIALAWGQFAFYEVDVQRVVVRESASDVVLS
jgi:hypothetical protein